MFSTCLAMDQRTAMPSISDGGAFIIRFTRPWLSEMDVYVEVGGLGPMAGEAPLRMAELPVSTAASLVLVPVVSICSVWLAKFRFCFLAPSFELIEVILSPSPEEFLRMPLTPPAAT